MRTSAILIPAALSVFSITVNGCGMWEYFEYTDLPVGVRTAANNLGYDLTSWNNPGTNPIDYIAFTNLTGIPRNTVAGAFDPLSEEELANLVTLDLDLQVCWDHFVNKYQGYSWADLQVSENPFGDNLGGLVEVLGWDEASWDATVSGLGSSTTVPASACSLWSNLEAIEKWAARGLGWSAQGWNDYPCDPRCPTSVVCP